MTAMTKNDKSEHLSSIEMTLAYFALILSILCRSLVFVFAKYAALDTAGSDIIQIVLSHWYWAELAALGMQTIFWIYVLKHLNLNVAYPAMALVYAVNLGWSWYLFNETVTTTHILGCCIIIIGVTMSIPPQNRKAT